MSGSENSGSSGCPKTSAPSAASCTAAGLMRRRKSSSIQDARVAGLYDLGQTIGKGHYAVVKLAKHVFTGEKVAVKVIDKTKLDRVSQQHIMQEVRCMKLVQHPSIVRLYEVIDTATKLFLILELADFDMYEYVQRYSTGIAEDEAQRHFAQIVDAIGYCHDLHVVHRDLKPENVVFFEKLGMVKLTDFGFSNVYSPGTLLDTSCGSLAYSAPEILLGDSYDAPAVDVWSLGVILYMFVTGRLPFHEANDSETLTKILDCSFLLPDQLSESCKNLICRMLVRDPEQRATLNELREHVWVVGGRTGHIELLPLVKRQQLQDDDHDMIVAQMVEGGIAPHELIHSSLDRNDYSHVTATYYLLAERVLKSDREATAAALLAEAAQSDNENINTLTNTEQTHAHTHVLMKIGEDSESSEEGAVAMSRVDVTAHYQPVHVNALCSISETGVGGSNTIVPPLGGRVRARTFSMVKEESEDEMSVGVSSRRSSRATSPVHALTRSHDRISPQAIQEMLDISGRFSATGRRSPDSRTTSRSPSPPNSNQATPNALLARLKSMGVTPQMRKLSSSPHLLGICEEGEDSESSSSGVHHHENGQCSACAGRPMGLPPPPTYSTVRMIRQRQAVVSPDVIKRYERGGSAGSRSRRSTSCSSSEASDDEGRLTHIARHCRARRRSGQDEDDSGGAGGGAGTGDHAHNGSTGHQPQSGSKGGNSKAMGRSMSVDGGAGQTPTEQVLDTNRLMGQLRQLALAPIHEIPLALPRFLRRPSSVTGTGRRPTNKTGVYRASVTASPSLLCLPSAPCTQVPVQLSSSADALNQTECNATGAAISDAHKAKWVYRLRKPKSLECLHVVTTVADCRPLAVFDTDCVPMSECVAVHMSEQREYSEAAVSVTPCLPVLPAAHSASTESSSTDSESYETDSSSSTGGQTIGGGAGDGHALRKPRRRKQHYYNQKHRPIKPNTINTMLQGKDDSIEGLDVKNAFGAGTEQCVRLATVCG